MDSIISNDFMHIFYSLVYHCVRPSILIVGIITCSFSAHVFLRMGLGDSVRMSFFVLCLYDLGFLLMSSVGAVCIIFTFDFAEVTANMTFNPFYVNYFSYWCANVFYHSSLMTTGYISGVRCCCVAIPFKFKSVFFTRKTVVTLLVIFVIFSIQLSVMCTQYAKYVTDKRKNVTKIVILPTTDHDLAVACNDVINRKILSWVTVTVMAVSLILMSVKLRSAAKFRNRAIKMNQHTNSCADKNQTGLINPIIDLSINLVGTPTAELQSSTVDKYAQLKLHSFNGCLVNEPGLKPENTKELQVIRSVAIMTGLFLILALPFMVYSLARRLMPEFNHAYLDITPG